MSSLLVKAKELLDKTGCESLVWLFTLFHTEFLFKDDNHEARDSVP